MEFSAITARLVSAVIPAVTLIPLTMRALRPAGTGLAQPCEKREKRGNVLFSTDL